MVDGRLVGVFDWELVADTEAVIAGFAASCYASSATGGGGLSTSGGGRRLPAGLRGGARAAAVRSANGGPPPGRLPWILAFNARWQVALIVHGICDPATIALVQEHQEDYLSLSW